MKRISGQRVEAISVANIPEGMRGLIEYVDLAGRLYVLWDNGVQGVIQERGESYRIIEFKSKPKKIIWNLKRIILFLLNK
jgi:hypothetical protein